MYKNRLWLIWVKLRSEDAACRFGIIASCARSNCEPKVARAGGSEEWILRPAIISLF